MMIASGTVDAANENIKRIAKLLNLSLKEYIKFIIKNRQKIEGGPQ